jgi:hypothetical protein
MMINDLPANVSLEPKFRFQYAGFLGTKLAVMTFAGA